MSNIRLANDRKTLFGTSIGETVKVHKEIRDDSYFRFDNVPNGVNRINFFCEDEGLYDVQVWQFIDDIATTSDTSGMSGHIPDGTLNHYSILPCYNSTTYSATGDLRLSKAATASGSGRITMGYIKTAVITAASGLLLDTGVSATSATSSVSAFLYYGFTTNKIVATLPLAPIYNDALDTHSAIRTIHVNIAGVGASPVEIQLTEEQGRTAVITTGVFT